jgi:hypothetical protein
MGLDVGETEDGGAGFIIFRQTRTMTRRQTTTITAVIAGETLFIGVYASSIQTADGAWRDAGRRSGSVVR